MRGKQRHISLNAEERSSLEQGYRNGKKPIFRQRCQALLFSDQGYSMDDLAKLYNVHRMTIGKWLDRYEQNGINGLHTQVGQGRKGLLSVDNADHVQAVKKYIEEDPQDLNHTLLQLKDQHSLDLSRYTLKRFLKKLAIVTNASDAGSPSKLIKS